MAKDPDELSVLEQRIMLALIRLHPDGYGVSVQDEILERTGKNVSFGSIYAAIGLEQRRLVVPREGEPLPERGGRRKVYFTVTVEGRRALAEAMTALDRLRDGIPDGVPA